MYASYVSAVLKRFPEVATAVSKTGWAKIVRELIAGVRSDVAIELHGDDRTVLVLPTLHAWFGEGSKRARATR